MTSVYIPTAADIAALKLEQQQRYIDRMNALMEVWTHELSSDTRLLRLPWEDPDVNRRPQFGPDDENSQCVNLPTLDGGVSILDEISKYATSRLSGTELQSWTDMLNSEDWKDRVGGSFQGL